MLPSMSSVEPTEEAQRLHVRTIEILWHCNERNEEAMQFGMQGNVVEGITSVDYNPRIDRIVTTGGDMCIRMWRLNRSALDSWLVNGASDMTACSQHVCTMQTGAMPLTARWSPQGEMVASAHCEGRVCLWWRDRSGSAAQTEEGGEEEWKDYRHLTGHISDVYDLSFSPDSRYLLSGAGDGSIVIHDLEGSAFPVVQLTEAHSKFCRGVAWDPWDRYVATFGSGPSLQLFTHVPRRDDGHRRMHLAAQRRCQGEFLGESCALSYRRLAWSPDGLLLAVPFGKYRGAGPTKQQQHQQPGGVGDGAEEDAVLAVVVDSGEDLMHCINLYTRGAPEKIAARLVVRGYNEVRGVQWAPCFLEPWAEIDQGGGGAMAAQSTPLAAATESCAADAEDAEAKAAAHAQRCGAWGPLDYMMALAAWTADAIIVYTTSSDTRHSDFTELHVRSITDVAWSFDAKFLFTASLDGYISVISFGNSLTLSHRLPTFSAIPTTAALCKLLGDLRTAGHALEAQRSTRAGVAGEQQPGGTGSAAVVVKKKRQKLEKAPDASAATASEVDLQQLEALLPDM